MSYIFDTLFEHEHFELLCRRGIDKVTLFYLIELLQPPKFTVIVNILTCLKLTATILNFIVSNSYYGMLRGKYIHTIGFKMAAVSPYKHVQFIYFDDKI